MRLHCPLYARATLAALLLGACATPLPPPAAQRPAVAPTPTREPAPTNTAPAPASVAPATVPPPSGGTPPPAAMVNPAPALPAPIVAPTSPSPAPATAPAAPAAVRFAPDDGALQVIITDQDWLAAWPAWLQSCHALTAPSNAHRAAWTPLCERANALKPRNGAQVREFFARSTDAYQVLGVGEQGLQAQGLMTGYYEPELEGSRTQLPGFDAPIYRLPNPPPTLPRGPLLASGALRGGELVWLRDPVEAFFLEVQGSGRIHLVDGDRIRVAYAGHNGQEYRSIGRWLIAQGELRETDVSMASIRDWARAHPQRLRELLDQNPRMVFFREAPAGDEGPHGTLGVALTPGISVAVDPKYLPLGAPLLVDTRMPGTGEALVRVVLAQDTGSAIRGPLRLDWFWGSGQAAGDIAGRQRGSGSVRVLVPRGIRPQELL